MEKTKATLPAQLNCPVISSRENNLQATDSTYHQRHIARSIFQHRVFSWNVKGTTFWKLSRVRALHESSTRIRWFPENKSDHRKAPYYQYKPWFHKHIWHPCMYKVHHFMPFQGLSGWAKMKPYGSNWASCCLVIGRPTSLWLYWVHWWYTKAAADLFLL